MSLLLESGQGAERFDSVSLAYAFHRAVVSTAVACGVGLGLVDGSASAGGQSGASAAMRELALGGILRH
jgi:hypothetical protein